MLHFKSAASFDVHVDHAMVEQFSLLSGDSNPLHVNEQEAAKTEFLGRVAHGALLLSFVSRMLGMEIPGKGCLLTNIDARFPKPLKPPDTIHVCGKLTVYNEERKDGKVNVEIRSLQGIHVEADVHFMLTGKSEPAYLNNLKDSNTEKTSEKTSSNRKKILVTGGTGGIGPILVKHLSSEYDLVLPTRKIKSSQNGIKYPQIDLNSQSELDIFLNKYYPQEFYAIIHMSSPRPQRFQITSEKSDLSEQLHHAMKIPIRLCRWARQEHSEIKRIILMGSVSGLKFLEVANPGYSLAKGMLNPLAQLLAVEMAENKCTVNVLAPGFVPVGINDGVPERKQLALAGLTPSGVLTQPFNISQAITFLLSNESSQINGTTLTLDGGFIKI